MKYVLTLSLLLFSASALAEDPMANAPDVTIEGLERVHDSQVQLLYIKPGADFSRFTQVGIMDPHVAFVEGYRRRMNSMTPHTQITQADLDEMKERLAALFLEVFTEELQNNGGYRVVDHAGDEVLVLRPAILDLDVVAPETSPNTRSAVPSAGQMTLYMELFDSGSGDLLAKVADHRFDRTRVNTHLRDRVRNERAARAMLGDWARMLREGLDEAHMNARGESSE